MSEQLATPEQNQGLSFLPKEAMVASSVTADAAASMVTGIDFLVRLQLNGSMANLAKQGKVPVGNFVLIKSKDVFQDLGKTVNMWMCAFRMKALDFKGDPVVVVYDPKTPEFQDIRERADADPSNSGCLAGFEFLCYIPDKNPDGKPIGFVSYYLCSKSARNEGPSFQALLGKPVTLIPHLVTNKKQQSWHVPKVLLCTVPLEEPEATSAMAVIERFTHPIATKVKKADVEAAGGRPQ